MLKSCFLLACCLLLTTTGLAKNRDPYTREMVRVPVASIRPINPSEYRNGCNIYRQFYNDRNFTSTVVCGPQKTTVDGWLHCAIYKGRNICNVYSTRQVTMVVPKHYIN